MDLDGEPVWYTLAWGSILLEPTTTTVEAELTGLAEALHATISWARFGNVEFDCSRVRLPT